jgi:hypothetical protein
MRKTLIAVSLAAAAAAGIARAEVAAEAIPAEVITQYGAVAVLLIQAQFPDPPVKVDPAPESAVGYHVEQKVGVVVIADRNLTQKAVEEAGEKSVPIGVLATQALTLQEKDAPIKGDRLAIADLNGKVKLPLFFLAVKGQGEQRILEVYSKDGKPLYTSPLKKQAGDQERPLGLKLSNIDLPGKKLDATVSVAGAYEGTLHLGFLEQ